MLPLTLKYRSQDFDSLEGQDLTRKVLKAASKAGKLSQAYLLTGPRGTGKTSMARIIAKAINCLDIREDGNPCTSCAICVQVRDGTLMDLIEIDAASHTGVDNIRELIDKARFLPSVARKKVYIVDEVHMLSKPAFNALLKTLEEPPSHVHFILATTELDRVPDTIVSRCQTFRFVPIPEEDIIKRLAYVCDQEGLSYEPAALQLIAKHSSGGLRDALTTLEKAIHEEEISAGHVQLLLGNGSHEAFDRIYAAVSQQDSSLVQSEVETLQATANDPAGLERSWLHYLQGILRTAVLEGRDAAQPLRVLEVSQETFDIFEGSSIPGLGLQVALLKASLPVVPQTLPPVRSEQRIESTPAPRPSSSVPTPPVSPIPAKMDPPDSMSTPPTSVSFDDIRSGWTGFAMTLPPVVKPLVSTSEPKELVGSTLTIEVGSRSYLERMQDRKTRSVLDDAFKGFFGSQVTFQFTLRENPPKDAGGSGAIDDALEVFA